MDDPQDEARDERLASELAVANGLAELSSVDVTPNEVETHGAFESVDVTFSDGGWLPYVLRVQDWLRPIESVLLDDAPEETARRFFAALEAEDPAGAFSAAADGPVQVTDDGLDVLRDRVERAIELKDKFLEALDDGSLDAATAAWISDWDDTVEETVSGPITAKAGVWTIHDFASRAKSHRLELSPSYQRGDVWPNKDAQLLIESILRGIPLPSVIILRPKRDGDVAYEVVDGKQRLTAILRFVGAHPRALQLVREAEEQHPGYELQRLFKDDYPRFRTAWRNATGEALSSTKERENHFPFKLPSSSKALPDNLRGRYYHAIKDATVRVGDESVNVSEIFETSTDYKIPVIEYTAATPRQIHEVFSLYNKQGKHLNAEEIRNAVYHEVDLMRALSVSAGDNIDLLGSAPFLEPAEHSVDRIRTNLNEYGVGDVRYRRTKILSWLFSLLFVESLGVDGKPRLLSTSQQINHLLDRVQGGATDAFRKSNVICQAVQLVACAMDAHAAADAWSDKFRTGGKGSRWQELQLVASLLGCSLAAAALGDQMADVMIRREADIRSASATAAWQRPKKTQTATQWHYIASVALALLDVLDLDLNDIDARLKEAYGASPIPALTAITASAS